MTGDLDNICNVFIQLMFIRSFPKYIFSHFSDLIYQLNSIEDNYLSPSFCRPIYPRDHPMTSLRGFPLSPINDENYFCKAYIVSSKNAKKEKHSLPGKTPL